MSQEYIRLDVIRDPTSGQGTSETETLLSKPEESHFAEDFDSADDNRSCDLDSDWQNIENDPGYQQATVKPQSFWPLRRNIPIIILVAQSIGLISMMTFIIRTSVDSLAVPVFMKHLYLKYYQFVPTVVTLIGSLISLINTKLFAEAVRFAITVWLGEPGSNGISLYSFYAATAISARSPLFNLDRRRIGWTITSILYFLLFLAQTTAWTALLTPRETAIARGSPGIFMDYNFSDAAFERATSLRSDSGDPPSWAQMASSGIVAVRQKSNKTQPLAFYDHTINGTTFGILPFPNITYEWNNWTRIEATQQGLTANVTCRKISLLDLAAVTTRKVLFQDKLKGTNYTQIVSCCNCTSFDMSVDESLVVASGADSALAFYVAFTTCPLQTANSITTYIISNHQLIGNLTCTLRPQLLNVNVTYNNGGVVALEPEDQGDIAADSSIIFFLIAALKKHFSDAQTFYDNSIVGIWNMLFSEEQHWPSPIENFTTVAMAAYIRGAFEQALTTSRLGPLIDSATSEYISQTAITSTIYVSVIVWGEVSPLKLAIAVIPLVIMITTISATLFSLRRARGFTPEHMIFFNPMDTLHVIAACNTGNINPPDVVFPDYSRDIGAFGNNLCIRLPAGQEGAAAGFQVHHSV